MKKFLITILLFFVAVFVSACGGSSNDTTVNDNVNFKLYASQDFAIRYPIDWEVKTAFDGKFPDSTVIVFVNITDKASLKANINIDRRSVSNVDNISFAKQMLNRHETDLIEYKKIAEQNLKVKVSGEAKDTVMTVFEGKNKTDGDRFQFIQIYAVKGSYAYIATGTMLAAADEATIQAITSSLKTLEIN